MKLSKEDRAFVKSALVKTLGENFPVLSEGQIDGIAEHFKAHMARVLAHCDHFVKSRTFDTADMKNAFAEVLAKRILHIDSLDEEPKAMPEAEDKDGDPTQSNML